MALVMGDEARKVRCVAIAKGFVNHAKKSGLLDVSWGS